MLEIKVTVDLSDRVVALIQALIPPKPTSEISAPAMPKPGIPQPPKTEKKTQEKSVETAQAETPVEEPTKTALSIVDLRALLRVKVNNDDNRELLTKKLKEYDASSITTLNKKHYDEFYAYMNTLP